jgi:hypothetical protein
MEIYDLEQYEYLNSVGVISEILYYALNVEDEE